MMDSWKKDNNGNIVLCPLTSYELLVSTSESPRVSLQLKFAQEGDSPNVPSGVTQLVFSPVRAQQLARALESAAQQALGGIDLTKLNNLS